MLCSSIDLLIKRNVFSQIASKIEFVRKGYEAFKLGIEIIIKCFFATFVSLINLDSLTSCFNIWEDIRRNEEFNEIMGFTELEVEELTYIKVDKELVENEKIEFMKNC